MKLAYDRMTIKLILQATTLWKWKELLFAIDLGQQR